MERLLSGMRVCGVFRCWVFPHLSGGIERSVEDAGGWNGETACRDAFSAWCVGVVFLPLSGRIERSVEDAGGWNAKAAFSGCVCALLLCLAFCFFCFFCFALVLIAFIARQSKNCDLEILDTNHLE